MEVVVSHLSCRRSGFSISAGARAWRAAAAIAMVAGLAAVGATGCAGHHDAAADDDTTTLVQDGSDTNATENDVETLSSSLIASTGTLGLASAGQMTGGDIGIADIGDGVLDAYAPAGCVTVTSDATTRVATYVFASCTGPYGLLALSGTIKATYTPLVATAASASAASLTLDLVGTDLQVNHATANWTAHAVIASGAAGARTMTWKAKLTGATLRGRIFSRTSTKTVAWSVGQECVLVNGSSDGDVGGRGLHTDVLHYSRCRGECPASGSEIRITNDTSGRTIDLTYDGGHLATYTAPNGSISELDLGCGL